MENDSYDKWQEFNGKVDAINGDLMAAINLLGIYKVRPKKELIELIGQAANDALKGLYELKQSD